MLRENTSHVILRVQCAENETGPWNSYIYIYTYSSCLHNMLDSSGLDNVAATLMGYCGDGSQLAVRSGICYSAPNPTPKSACADFLTSFLNLRHSVKLAASLKSIQVDLPFQTNIGKCALQTCTERFSSSMHHILHDHDGTQSLYLPRRFTFCRFTA